MYQVELKDSYFAAQGGQEPEPTTIGDMLRQSVERTPDRIALKELDYDGKVGRTWSYTQLLADTERLARALMEWRGETEDPCLDPEFVEETLWSEVILELKPVGLHDAEVVWRWDLFDHLVHADHGIGVYRGLVEIETRYGGSAGEMMSIEYAGGLAPASPTPTPIRAKKSWR